VAELTARHSVVYAERGVAGLGLGDRAAELAVRTVAVTHLHGDHFGGLPFHILNGQFSRRTEPLLVAGPPGIRDRSSGNPSASVLRPQRS
jgi:ribonuclease BN (tRNA processing enzyme)